MICLSETYLDSSYAYDDTRLNLKDFILIRAVNPHNCKRGRVSIYFKEHLAVRPVSPSNLNEYKDEFDQFLLDFEQLISDRMSQNLHFILVTGDFNV